MKFDILNISGDKTGEVEVDPEVFGPEADPALMHRVIVSYEANKRQGSACTKNRGERAGSGRKPWAQKHTGRARAGSIRSPLWRKGGVTFGPKPRDFRMKLSRKEKDVALRGALRGKMQDSEIKIIENLDVPEAKTRLVAAFLKKAGIAGSVMFVSKDRNKQWLKASRNISSVATMPSTELNAYSVLRARQIVVERSVLDEWTGKNAK